MTWIAFSVDLRICLPPMKIRGKGLSSKIIAEELPSQADPFGSEKKPIFSAGFTKEHARLPEFFVKEPLPPSGNVFDVPQEEIDSMYEF